MKKVKEVYVYASEVNKIGAGKDVKIIRSYSTEKNILSYSLGRHLEIESSYEEGKS